ncbi:unnamed protein product [Cunninghamella blakesleeana]
MDTLRLLNSNNHFQYTEEAASPSSSITSHSQTAFLSSSGSTSSSDSSVSSPPESSASLPQIITTDQHSKIIKRQKTQCGLEAVVEKCQSDYHQQQNNENDSSKPDYSWKLTVTKGNLVIHTNIKTHAELLDYLHKSVSALEINQFVPYSLNDTKPKDILLSKLIQIFIWKRYGKSRFKSILYGKPNCIKPTKLMIEGVHNDDDEDDDDKNNKYDDNYEVTYYYGEDAETVVQQLLPQLQYESINSITIKILHAYFQCQHLNHLAIHVPTFLKLYVKNQVMDSPVVLALCAVACTTSCLHISHVLQNQNPLIYSCFYFNRARDLIADMFDHLDLEAFAAYTLMALHKFILFQYISAQTYMDMAERLLYLLEDTYNEPSENIKDDFANEKFLFDRLKVQLSKIAAVIELHKFRVLEHNHKHHHYQKKNNHSKQDKPLYKHERDRNRHGMPDRRVLNIFHGSADILVPVLGDSEEEKRHIMLSVYISKLHKECHDAAFNAPSNDTEKYIGIIGHMLEMVMRRWYASLPDSFGLSIPIFDEFENRTNFNEHNKSKWIIALEKTTDVVPILSTMTVYNEFLMMTIAHLSKGPDDLETRNSIAKYWNKSQLDLDKEFIREQWGDKWIARLEKMNNMYKHKVKSQYDHNELDDYNNIDSSDDDDNMKNKSKREKINQDMKILTSVLVAGYAGFDDPIGTLSVTVANNTLILLQYIKLQYPCHFDIRVGLNVCRVLIRAAKFGYGDENMQLKIQANILCCLSMIREEYNRSSIYASVKEPIGKIEKEYDELISMDIIE